MTDGTIPVCGKGFQIFRFRGPPGSVSMIRLKSDPRLFSEEPHKGGPA
jgi:hypothetical protein